MPWWRRARRYEPAGPSRVEALTGRRSWSFTHELADIAASRREFRGQWVEAADGCRLARTVKVPAGVTVVAPRLASVFARDDALELRVEMLPGQAPADYVAVGPELARALGGARLDVRECGGMWLLLRVLWTDPLEQPYQMPPTVPDGFLGIDEAGMDVVVPWHRRAHTLIAGQTGSGKSVFVYGALAGLADRDDVLVTGVDPSRLLWAPWERHPRPDWRVSGLAGDLSEHRVLLRALCDEMDARLKVMPRGVDAIPTNVDMPLVVVMLEEYAGFLRAADTTGTGKSVGNEVRALTARLLSEGRKTGIRVVISVQRADAVVIDGYTRAQASTRITFASEPDGIRMSHPPSAVPDLDGHALAPPGVALCTSPVLGTVRFRAGDMSYGEYVERVEAGGSGPALRAIEGGAA